MYMGNKIYCRNYARTVSHVLRRRFIIPCPYLGESTIRGSTVPVNISKCSILHSNGKTTLNACTHKYLNYVVHIPLL